MPFGQSATPTPPSRSAGRYRWVTVWLVMGCAIALLLIANAVRDYRFVARLLAVQAVRHRMTQISVQVEQQFRRTEAGRQPLETALAATLRTEESVALRDPKGVLLEHIGPDLSSSLFSLAEEHEAFERREPLFRTFTTPRGNVVVEVFAMHTPHRTPPERSTPDTQPLPAELAGPRFMTLEVASPLVNAGPSVLAPIRHNLTINVTAALALLATVLLAGVGLRSYTRGRRLEEQVEIARQVQSRLLPDPSVQLPGIEMATVYQPSEQVGGDFYDVFTQGKDGFAAVIGDVSGKGLPAALLMGVIHGAVRTAGWQEGEASHKEESGKLNRLLCERASSNRFASMFWCSYDSRLRSMRYVNAGHCLPFLLGRRDGALAVERLGAGGPVLGLLPQATYDAVSVEIRPGDLLVMYSDGLVEAVDPSDQEYGEDRLETFLQSHFDESPDLIRKSLLRSWAIFSPQDAMHDDLTFAIIRF